MMIGFAFGMIGFFILAIQNRESYFGNQKQKINLDVYRNAVFFGNSSHIYYPDNLSLFF